MKINIEFIRKLAFVSKFANKNDVRFQLRGVHLESDGVDLYMVATDGAILCHSKVTLNTGSKFNITLPIEEITNLFKSKTISEHSEVVMNENSMVIKNRSSEVTIKKLESEAQFPNWRKILPKEERKVDLDDGISFDLEYMVKINDAFRFAKNYLNSKNKYLITKFGDKHSSISIHFNNFDLTDTQIILMPARL